MNDDDGGYKPLRCIQTSSRRYQPAQGISGTPQTSRSRAGRALRDATGQADAGRFTVIRRGREPLLALVATLGYSRASFVRFTAREDAATLCECLREALVYFGGTPEHVLFDNAKSVVIERDAFGVGEHRWNPQLLALAETYGFTRKVCRPYRAKTKGKVERFNRYLKESFVVPLAATLKSSGLKRDVETANAHLGRWLLEVANVRRHATTGERPAVLLDAERAALLPLPAQAPVLAAPDNRRVLPRESLQHPLAEVPANGAADDNRRESVTVIKRFRFLHHFILPSHLGQPGSPKATETLKKDRESLLAFYDFPAEHWQHLRMTNAIESTFATVRHRTTRTRNCVSRPTFLGLAFKLIEEAEKTRRRINGPEQIQLLLAGIAFKDGEPVQDEIKQFRFLHHLILTSSPQQLDRSTGSAIVLGC
jgi:hypothetical protein